MLKLRRTPLAWLSLTHNRFRFLGSTFGIAFAVFIIFIEVGYLNGVYDSQTNMVSYLNTDLIIINRLKEDLLPTQPFTRHRLLQALAVEGVEAAYPIYMEEYASTWKKPDASNANILPTMAFNPDQPALLIPELDAYREELTLPDTALIDNQSRKILGNILTGNKAELANRSLRLVGTFQLGPNFRADGLLIMSDENFFRFFPDRKTGLPNRDRIELGLLRIAQRSDPDHIKRTLSRNLPDDVLVLTKYELVERIESFWRTFQPIGTVFTLGAAVGFVIGVTICYQILFTDITDYIKQYATLKAIGYLDRYLVGLVLQKAVYLSLLGFIPGVLLGALAYSTLQSITGIQMWLNTTLVLTVLTLTVAMCMVSAALAVLKVLKNDPAELFH